MIAKNELEKVKENLDTMVGQRIQLTAKKGRKRSVVRNGIIEQTYPCIFVVKLDSTQLNDGRRISYSYTDVLTKTVELVRAKAE